MPIIKWPSNGIEVIEEIENVRRCPKPFTYRRATSTQERDGIIMPIRSNLIEEGFREE